MKVQTLILVHDFQKAFQIFLQQPEENLKDIINLVEITLARII